MIILPGMGACGLAAVAFLVSASGVDQAEAGRQAYFRAVAEFFSMAPAEVSILSEWSLPAEEVPVVLFVARRAGVSPDAVVALRRTGWGWGRLIGRYQLDAAHFHVPLSASADAGRLRDAYARFSAAPPERWSGVSLEDREIIDLVNLRVVAQTLRRTPGSILAEAPPGVTWVQVYERLIGDLEEGSGVVG